MATSRPTTAEQKIACCYALSVEPRLLTLRYRGVTIAESSCAIRADRPGSAPVYFVPTEDVAPISLQASATLVTAPGLGRARVVNVCTGEKTLRAAAYRLEEPTALGSCLAGRVGFDAARFEQIQKSRSSID